MKRVLGEVHTLPFQADFDQYGDAQVDAFIRDYIQPLCPIKNVREGIIIANDVLEIDVEQYVADQQVLQEVFDCVMSWVALLG